MPRARSAAVLAVIAAFVASSAGASGFAFFDQGAKAAGMAGAFTAQADDGSAVFYNVGGLALAPGKKLVWAGSAGLFVNESLYQGAGPGIGAGTAAEQDPSEQILPHAYVAKKVGSRLTLAMGAFSPFWLATEWAAPATYAGRYAATAADLETYDAVPAVAWQVTPKFGIGIGAVYRLAEVSVTRRLDGTNPFTGQVQDFARIDVDSDQEGGYGWTAGFLAKPTASLAVGLSYRSAIDVDFQAGGTLTAVPTGNAQLDELIAASLPLGVELPVASEISFPDRAAAGVALAIGERGLIEVDGEWTGWSRTEALPIVFTANSEFSHTYALAFDDTLAWRLGFRLKLPNQFEVRLGAALEESPQPSSTVAPLVVDADTTVFAAGLGRDWLDVALAWRQSDDRTVADSREGLNGSYRGSSWLALVTISK